MGRDEDERAKVAGMELTQFDINLLRALDVLLQERSVTRAARRLFVSQSAASGSLQRLREIFEDQLLIRVGRGMELTPRGIALERPVHEAMLRLQELLDVRPEFEPAMSKRAFRLVMSDYCAHTILPAVIRRVSEIAPNVKILLVEWSSADFDALQIGDADVQITLDDQRLFADDDRFFTLNRLPLVEDRFVCVVAKDHPLGETMTLQDYVKFPHATLMTRSINAIGNAHASANITVTDVVSTASFTTLLAQLPQTQMISLIPNELAEMYAPMLGLRIIDPPFKVDRLTEAAFWHVRNNDDPGHIWLRNLLCEVCDALRLARRKAKRPG